MRTLKRALYQAQYSSAFPVITVTGRWVAAINQPGRRGCFWLAHDYAVIFVLWQLCQVSHTTQYLSPHKTTCLSSHCAKHYQDQRHKWPLYFNDIGNTAQQTPKIEICLFVCLKDMSPYIQQHLTEAHISMKRNWFGSNIRDCNIQPLRPFYYISEVSRL